MIPLNTIRNLLLSAESESEKLHSSEVERICKDALALLPNLRNLPSDESRDEILAYRMRALRLLCISLLRIGKTEESLEFAKEWLGISMILRSDEERGASLSFAGNAYFALSDYKYALESHELSLQIHKKLALEERIAKDYSNMAMIYYSLADYSRALELMRLAIGMNEKSDNQKSLGNNLDYVGTIYFALADYSRALEYYQKSLEIHESIGCKEHISANLGNIGMVYAVLSNFEPALEYFQKSLALSEEIGRKSGTISDLCNVGSLYCGLSDFQHALEYFQKALALSEEIGNKTGIASNLGNIGIIESELGHHQKSIEFHQKALKIHEEIASQSGISTNLGNIGNAYVALHDYPQAMECYRKALAVSEEFCIQDSVALNIGAIGRLYAQADFHECDLAQAETHLLHALKLFNELGLKREKHDFLNVLIGIYSSQHRWEEAFALLQQSHEIEKEVQNEEVRKQAQRFTLDREMAVIRKEQEIMRLKNTELAEINAELEHKNALLHMSNTEKNEFLGVAAHDLKNPLSAVMVTSELIIRNIEKISQVQIISRLQSIHSAASYMHGIILNLLNINALEQGKIEMHPQVWLISDLAKNIVESSRERADRKNITLYYREENASTFALCDKALVMQIIDNLVSNAVKYSPHGKEVVVSVEKLG